MSIIKLSAPNSISKDYWSLEFFFWNLQNFKAPSDRASTHSKIMQFTLHCGPLSKKTVSSLYLFGETCCKLKKGKSILCSRLWSSSFHALLLLVITQVKFLLQNNSLIIVQLTTALLNRGSVPQTSRSFHFWQPAPKCHYSHGWQILATQPWAPKQKGRREEGGTCHTDILYSGNKGGGEQPRNYAWTQNGTTTNTRYP